MVCAPPRRYSRFLEIAFEMASTPHPTSNLAMENRGSRYPWLFDPALYLLAFLGSAVVALGLLALGAPLGLIDEETPDWVWVATILMIDVAPCVCDGVPRLFCSCGTEAASLAIRIDTHSRICDRMVAVSARCDGILAHDCVSRRIPFRSPAVWMDGALPGQGRRYRARRLVDRHGGHLCGDTLSTGLLACAFAEKVRLVHGGGFRSVAVLVMRLGCDHLLDRFGMLCGSGCCPRMDPSSFEPRQRDYVGDYRFVLVCGHHRVGFGLCIYCDQCDHGLHPRWFHLAEASQGAGLIDHHQAIESAEKIGPSTQVRR